jgi:hypothetical protein
LSLWKCRFGIDFKKAHGEKGSADALSAEQWKSTKLPNLLQKFCADDMYNADETGLFYHATPAGSLSYKHATLSGSEKAMDCVTVLCCSNLSGTDKRKLLVIGKRAKPRYFKGLVWAVYQFCTMLKTAWITSKICRKLLICWDVELQRKPRTNLLVHDNCAAHPYLDSLKNIQLNFCS